MGQKQAAGPSQGKHLGRGDSKDKVESPRAHLKDLASTLSERGAAEGSGKGMVRSGSGSPRIPLASLLRQDHAIGQKRRTQVGGWLVQSHPGDQKQGGKPQGDEPEPGGRQGRSLQQISHCCTW